VYDVQRFAPLALRLVRGVQPVEHPRDHADHVPRWHQLSELARVPDEPRETFPLQVFHDQEHLARHVHHVERSHYVGVLDARREPRFVEEHRDELGIFRVLRVQAFDRDRA
jgi:hypothetical protein